MDTLTKAAYLLAKTSASFVKVAPEEELKIRSYSFAGKCFECGFAQTSITPPDLLKRTYWMAGYDIWKKITGILDETTASAMWLSCGGDGIILLSCDLIGITGFDLDIIRKKLRSFSLLSGCKHIILSCTHTHGGIDTMGYWGPLPKSGKDEKYMDFLMKKLEEICVNAYKNRKQGKLYYGNIEAAELVNRWREPMNFTNNRLNRFRFVPFDGSKEIWYLNFGAHPNTMGGKNKMLSADYPCYMRREIKRHIDADILFSISTIGTTDIGKIGERPTERTILGGYMLGQKALQIDNDRELSADISLIVKHFVMPIDNPVLAVANKVGIFTTKKCSSNSDLGIGFVSELNLLDIGGVKILTCPGEMFSELVLEGGYCDAASSATGAGAEINPEPLNKLFGTELIIFGVTNDMAGYCVAPNDFILDKKRPFIDRGKDRFDRSHYHETNSCGINTGKTIYDACVEIKNEMKKIKKW